VRDAHDGAWASGIGWARPALGLIVLAASGAVCVYLLIGFLYTFAYGAVAALGSSDFFAQGTDGTTAIRVYFSYVTLATLGYGDYTAARTLGRSLAVSEALFGQLYLVTVVALLVGSFGQSRREPRRSPEA
jgi:hypothetical protein